MYAAACLALHLVIVCGFPQPRRRASEPTSAEEIKELVSLYEPTAFATGSFLQCCKHAGFDDPCANFMCQWQNVWRVEPGMVNTEGHMPKTCIETVPQFNAYKKCLTNFKDNRACCKAAMPNTMKRTNEKCAEICDGTRDFTAGASLDLFRKCSSFKNDTVTEKNRPNAEFFRLLWCNAGAHLSPTTTTHNPLNATIDCAATKTVEINGFKVVGCVKA